MEQMEEKSRKMSLKVFLTGLVMLSMILVGAVSTLVGVWNLRVGMQDEVQQGVKAACQTYAMVLQYTVDDAESSAGLEADMHAKTGYDFPR